MFWKDSNRPLLREHHLLGNSIEDWKQETHWQRRMSNKSLSRRFVEMHGFRVPHLYRQFANVDEVDFDSLPGAYVIRPTIGCGSQNVHLIDSQRDLMSGGKLCSPETLIASMRQAQRAYPKAEILIEEFLVSEDGARRILDDYKFYVFNGHIAFVNRINRSGPHTGRSLFYDADWRFVEPMNTTYRPAEPLAPPRCRNELTCMAATLSRAYEMFVRVDCYATNRGAVFGEFTPTPHLGGCFTPEGERILLDYWDRYCPGMI